MPKLPTICPLCGGKLIVTSLECQTCGTKYEGVFTAVHSISSFDRLTAEQLQFLEIFIRNEGKFSRMEKETGLSYPTLRNRLHAIIRAMGYKPEEETPSKPSPEERLKILEDLEQGKITTKEAARLLRGEKQESEE